VKLSILVAVLIALAAIAPSVVEGARVDGASPPRIGLGFGPADIAPLSQGTPIFTNGDSIWVQDEYNFSVFVSLYSPDGTIPVPIRSAPSDQPTLLYTFGPSDEDGNWSLTVTGLTGTTSTVPIRLVGHEQQSAPILTDVAFQPGGQLAVGFSLPPQDEYDVQACTTASGRLYDALFQVPPSLGIGKLAVQVTDSNATISAPTHVADPFSFWLELYHPYSFSVGTGGEVVSQDLDAANVNPVSFTTNSSVSGSVLPVMDRLPFREGRYTLRGYFRSGSGLSVQETSVLRTASGGWVWLGACVSLQTVQSQRFEMHSNLTTFAESWLTGLLTMSRVGGVEVYSFETLSLGLSAAAVVGAPWNIALPYVQVKAVGPTILGSAETDSTLYVLSSHYPVNATLQVSVGTANYSNQSLYLARAYSLSSVEVSVGLLVVQATEDGQAKSGLKVTIRTQKNTTVTSTTNGTGAVTFALPAGEYSASVSIGSVSDSASANVVAGEQVLVSLDMNAQAGQSLIIGLVLLALAGIVANVWVWLRVKRGRIQHTLPTNGRYVGSAYCERAAVLPPISRSSIDDCTGGRRGHFLSAATRRQGY